MTGKHAGAVLVNVVMLECSDEVCFCMPWNELAVSVLILYSRKYGLRVKSKLRTSRLRRIMEPTSSFAVPV